MQERDRAEQARLQAEREKERLASEMRVQQGAFSPLFCYGMVLFNDGGTGKQRRQSEFVERLKKGSALNVRCLPNLFTYWSSNIGLLSVFWQAIGS